MKKIIQYTLLIFIISSCKQEEIDQLLLSITPDIIQIIKSPDEVISFGIVAKSDKKITQLLITEREENSIEFDTLSIKNFSATNYTTQFLYKLKELQKDTTLSYITFNITQEDGTSKNVVKRILNIKKARNLTEKTGNIFHSHKIVAQKQDAYNLVEAKSEFSTIADKSLLHIVDDTTSNNSETISKTWVSFSGGKFRRDNNFDYVNATSISLRNAFETGQQVDKITSLQKGDIILFRNSKNGVYSYYAVKITAIEDQTGTENDSYEFNYKY
jgi:hypothetical protein